MLNYSKIVKIKNSVLYELNFVLEKLNFRLNQPIKKKK